MTTSPILTIIIASFNANSIIASALQSVLDLRFDAWECLVIDGGSSDGTQQTVTQYALLDSRIQLHSEPDKGIYDAFNKGVRLALGEWIYFLGADDHLYPESFTQLLGNDHSCYDIIYGDIDYNNTYGVVHRKSNPDPQSLRWFMSSHQAFVMRRSVILAYGGFDYKHYCLCADYHLVLRAFISGARAYHRDVTVCLFNTCGTSNRYQLHTECFRIRKELHSISAVTNLYYLCKNVLLMTLRRIKAHLSCFHH